MKKLTILLALAFPAHAEFFSGNDLLTRMQSDSSVERSIALGFVVGVADAWDGMLFCAPDNVTAGQTRDIALRFLIINPQKRHQAAVGMVSDALAEAWPCAKKPKVNKL